MCTYHEKTNFFVLFLNINNCINQFFKLLPSFIKKAMQKNKNFIHLRRQKFEKFEISFKLDLSC